MPVEFRLEPTGSSDNSLFRLTMAYDGSGRRISKTVMHKVAGAADWDTAQVTHYTGIGTEIRENYAGPAKQTKVVVKSLQGECRKNKLACSYDRAAAADAGGVNMPQGLGRYGIEDAENPDMGSGVGYIPNTKFEWYLKNHLGSTMLVYGTVASTNPNEADVGARISAYDYRSFGEMVELTPPPTGKVTENFTGKEHDDEIALNYFGARYLDPMLGMWTSVDPARQFASPYLYAGNGMNPVNLIDPDGSYSITKVDEKYAGAIGEYHYHYASYVETLFFKIYDIALPGGSFIISSKPDYEIENSLRPEKTSSLFSAVVDLLNFIPFLRPATVPLSTAEKSMKKVGVGNTLYSAVSIEGNPFFENFMSQLTSSNGIYGSSIEEVKTKAAWANAYGWELYKNDVKITDDIKRAYGEAYQSKFGNNDE